MGQDRSLAANALLKRSHGHRVRNLLGAATVKSAKSIDQTAALADSALPDGQTVGADQTSQLDQRRRRLVRSAMAVAPLVLTLRSGALAAASCTGVRIWNPQPVVDPLGRADNGLAGVEKSDYCTTGTQICGDARDHPRLSHSNSSPLLPVEQQGSGYTCPSTIQRPVAILSAGAYNSFVHTG